MSSTQFTETSEMNDIMDRCEALKGKHFSDITDAKGNQYVDLVQEGGGVLGIALAGYTYVLEKAGIRFFSLAGTSAGAINTILLAGLDKIENPKSEKILKILSEKNLFDLVDGKPGVRKIIKKLISKEKGIGWLIAFNVFTLYKALMKRLGLNPGKDFVNWIGGELKKENVDTLQKLLALRKQLPEGLKCDREDNPSVTDLEAKLAVIASDITTHSKADFPRMAKLYWKDVDSINPAQLARASMSIPFFFEPFVVKDTPNAGQKDNEDWKEYAGYNGDVPDKVRFVDGGMLSNFPINIFHREDGGVPRMPTFGARLSTYRQSYSDTDSFMGMNGAMISTMRQIHDYDFLLKNEDYKLLICPIGADKEFNWLDFNMKPQDQIDLFTMGATKAIEFLEGFDWEDYKKKRKEK